jgi:ADP-ribose pyrophosphatase YjhB (NUDIX family)
LFFNCGAAAAAFIFHGSHVIVCERAHEPAKGMLDFPGGFLEFDETAEDGLRREIREELHIEVEGLRYLASFPNDYRYAEVDYKTLDLFFVCSAPEIGGIMAADDVAGFSLERPERIEPGRLAFKSARAAWSVLMANLPAWLARG